MSAAILRRNCLNGGTSEWGSGQKSSRTEVVTASQ
jgi:hypothetical protein